MAMQRQDPRWRAMIDYLQGVKIPRSKHPRTTIDQFALGDEIFYFSKREKTQELRKAAMQHIHEKESGHVGQHKSILKAEEYFYWPNTEEIKQYMKECVTCQQFKTNQACNNHGKSYHQ